MIQNNDNIKLTAMSDQETKRCRKCGEVKPRPEFNRCASKKDGLQSYCKCCVKRHYAENREKILERKKRYYAENKEKMADQKRRFRAENREKVAGQNRRYYYENKFKRITNCYDSVLAKMWHNEKPCCEFCGVSGLPEMCYDYHHLDQAEKRFGISLAAQKGYPADEIVAEMQKTIRLCATCHRLFHHVGTPLRNIDQNNIQLKRDENVSERQT